MSTPNPLLNISDLPPFDQIQPDQVISAVDQLLAENRSTVETTLKAVEASGNQTWQQLITPLE